MPLKLNTGFPGGNPHGGIDSAPLKKLMIIAIETADPVNIEVQTSLLYNNDVTITLGLHRMGGGSLRCAVV